MDETEPSPPLGQERIISEDPRQIATAWIDHYEKEAALTRRFYLFLLGLIVLISIIGIIIIGLDNDPKQEAITSVAVIGAVAAGALASLAVHDRR